MNLIKKPTKIISHKSKGESKGVEIIQTLTHFEMRTTSLLKAIAQIWHILKINTLNEHFHSSRILEINYVLQTIENTDSTFSYVFFCRNLLDL